MPEILWCLTWLAIAAFVVAVACGCATTDPVQETTASAGRDVQQTTQQETENTSGGLTQRADRVEGAQTANQFDLSRNQLLLALSSLAALIVVIVGGMAWAHFLGWFVPQPADATVAIMARVYVVAYPTIVVAGSGTLVWIIVRMLQ